MNQKTPKDTRFRPGQSGNPKGRPKRTTAVQVSQDLLRETFLAQAMQPIRVKRQGKYIMMPKIAAIIEIQLDTALKGNRLAGKLVWDTMERLAYDHDALRAHWIGWMQKSEQWEHDQAEGKNPKRITVPDPPDTAPPSRRRR